MRQVEVSALIEANARPLCFVHRVLSTSRGASRSSINDYSCFQMSGQGKLKLGQ
jgi:hypothetical protein